MVWGVEEGAQLVAFPRERLFLERVMSFGNIASVVHIKLLVSKQRSRRRANTIRGVLLKWEGDSTAQRLE